MSDICALLHQKFNNFEKHYFPFDIGRIPSNGIYVLFEKGELAHEGNRIVRIGTHTGKKQLRSRLNQHFINENKDRSIFRKNIGRALLNLNNDPFLEQWNWDLTTHKAKEIYGNQLDRSKQLEIERAVTRYIQNNFSFVVFSVFNREERLFYEARIISTVSLCKECQPSSAWLGLASPKAKIREGGLWQVNELYKTPLSEKELNALQQIMD